jgi:Holliday junction resolvase RusA-like endonuclease
MDNPFIFKLNLRVPSLKNNKIPIEDKEGRLKLISNSRVDFFNKTTVPLLKETQKRQEFVTIPKDTEVLALIRVVSYGKKQIANKDLDNMWTTIQETLQHADIVENDNQTCGTWTEKHTTGIKALQHFAMWLWVADSQIPYFEQVERVYHDIVCRKKV